MWFWANETRTHNWAHIRRLWWGSWRCEVRHIPTLNCVLVWVKVPLPQLSSIAYNACPSFSIASEVGAWHLPLFHSTKVFINTRINHTWAVHSHVIHVQRGTNLIIKLPFYQTMYSCHIIHEFTWYAQYLDPNVKHCIFYPPLLATQLTFTLLTVGCEPLSLVVWRHGYSAVINLTFSFLFPPPHTKEATSDQLQVVCFPL